MGNLDARFQQLREFQRAKGRQDKARAKRQSSPAQASPSPQGSSRGQPSPRRQVSLKGQQGKRKGQEGGGRQASPSPPQRSPGGQARPADSQKGNKGKRKGAEGGGKARMRVRHSQFMNRAAAVRGSPEARTWPTRVSKNTP